MAGSIPPLVSSSPPPLCAFDDEDEEEEDEFGMYAVAEELDCNDCIPYGGKEEGKRRGVKTRGEQDSTSQGSATDSGLCPDSEGMSPTPHSDDERHRVPNGHAELAEDTFSTVDGSLVNNIESTCSTVAETEGCDSATPAKTGDCDSVTTAKTGDCDNVAPAKTGDCDSATTAKTGNCDSAITAETGDCDSATPAKTDCDTAITAETGNYDSAIPTVEETFRDHDTNLFKNFQDNCESVLNGSTEQAATFENIELLKNDVDSPTEIVLSSEIDKKQSDALDVQDLDDFEGFHKFTLDNLSVVAPTFEAEVKQEDSELHQQFGEFTESKSDFCDESYNFKFNSEDCSGFTGEVPSSESMQLKNIECLQEKMSFDKNEDTSSVNEDQKDTQIKELDNNLQLSDEEDDFDDFTEFKESVPIITGGISSLDEHPESVPLEPAQQDESEDKFSNFADFSTSSCAFVDAQSSNSLDSTSNIPSKPCDDTYLRTDSEFQDWVSVFPPCTESNATSAPSAALLQADDPVWARLTLPEGSPALSLQWVDCRAHTNLLAALHIDSRNILWNPGVPRFAATLSRGPLQPTAAPAPVAQTQTTPAPAPSSVPASAPQESVPDAHFDWGSSGLTNPLDSGLSSLPDLHFLVALSSHLTSPKPVLSLPKTLSAEAEAILSSLRDLSFLKKNYIVFPISES